MSSRVSATTTPLRANSDEEPISKCSNVVRLAWMIALTVSLADACGGRSAGGQEGSICEKDFDCEGALICDSGQCRDARRSIGSTASGGAASTGGTGGRSNSAGAGGTRVGAGGTTSGAAGDASTGGTSGAAAGDTGGTSSLALASACDALKGGRMLTCLDIDASALIADPGRGRLYAVVKAGAAEHANELVVIDPERATVETSIIVGSYPDSLALSDDATRLWVGLRGALAIREVDLTQSPPEPGTTYAVPKAVDDVLDATYAGPMVALNGERDSIAVALQYEDLSPSGAGVALLDSGSPRAKRVGEEPGVSVLAAGPTGYLFGVDDQYQLLSIAVEANGLVDTRHAGLLPGGAFRLVYDDGLLFASSGRVFDVSSPGAPALAGSFPNAGHIVSHSADSSVIMLSNTNSVGNSPSSPIGAINTLALRRLDRSTFKEQSNVALDGQYLSIRDFVEPVPGIFAFVDWQPVSFGTPETVRTAVVLVSMPEFAESAR
jgi:hypothetical protein